MGGISAEFTVLIVGYSLLVMSVGLLARRSSARSPEEYFLAGRGLSTVTLFMALFGTNCTAFVLVGVPGQAYHDGVGVFGLNAPIVALGIPLSFWAVGVPARRMARRLGALTPAELYAKRLGSRTVGRVLFFFFTLYTLPYMVTAVEGASKVLSQVAGIPPLVGGAAVLLLALGYTSIGGMRATAWTNVVQGTLFMVFMVGAFFVIARSMGGLGRAFEQVRSARPELLGPGVGRLFEPRAFASWSLAISLTVIAFPHMLVRLFAARDERSLKRICRLYPLALVALWLPAVMIGVWGAVEFPGWEGRASDAVFARMILEHLPPLGAALGFLAVLAAVMSTLDAQLLTLGSMLTRDVLKLEGGRDAGSRQVSLGRALGALVALAVFVLWQAMGDSIFGVASVAFSGYVTLAPVLLLGVRWRRLTAAGALASMLAGNSAYFLALSRAPELAGAALQPAWLGFLPVAWGFAAAVLGAVLVSSMTRPVSEEQLGAAFGAAEPA